MARFSRKRRRFNVGLECYTPVSVQIELLAVWQTAKIILTNPSMKFHCDACGQL